jgi:hypothetical protein
MRRFWVEFDVADWSDYPAGAQMGCGVTAHDLQDALRLVTERLFAGFPEPKVRKIVPDIDVSSLDERNVLPHIGNVLRRGIWFPLGYEITRF